MLILVMAMFSVVGGISLASIFKFSAKTRFPSAHDEQSNDTL